MRSLLNHHVEAFERSADELRTQASNPRGALASQSDIEFLMATLVGHFNALGAAVARHQAAQSPTTDDDMREIHESCRRLAPIFDQVLGHGSAIERAGGRVAGKSEFLAAWRELKGIVAIDPAGVAESFAQLRRGEGRSLGEFADELSRDLEPQVQQDIRNMPVALARDTLAQLRNLEAAPTALSRRSHFPFREQCQIFNFDYRTGGVYYVVNVLFQQPADEQTLLIADIPWTTAEEWPI